MMPNNYFSDSVYSACDKMDFKITKYSSDANIIFINMSNFFQLNSNNDIEILSVYNYNLIITKTIILFFFINRIIFKIYY